MAGRGKLSEGIARESAVANSVVPVDSSACGEMMSIGDADSATVRSATRVPVTIRVSSVFLGRRLRLCSGGGSGKRQCKNNGNCEWTGLAIHAVTTPSGERVQRRGPFPGRVQRGSCGAFQNH